LYNFFGEVSMWFRSAVSPDSTRNERRARKTPCSPFKQLLLISLDDNKPDSLCPRNGKLFLAQNRIVFIIGTILFRLLSITCCLCLSRRTSTALLPPLHNLLKSHLLFVLTEDGIPFFHGF